MTENTNTPKNELSEDQIANLAYLRIKIKHLAVEPGIIREEHAKRRRHAEKHDYRYTKWLEVRTRAHRLVAVRPEARAALLAYAFIRNKSYGRTEQAGKEFPFTRVAELVIKYGNLPQGTTKKEAENIIADWVINTVSIEARAA